MPEEKKNNTSAPNKVLPNPLWQLSLRYSLANIGFLEILQLDVSSLNLDNGFIEILERIKELRFFRHSQFYLRCATSTETSFEKDIFANFIYHKIDEEDYVFLTYNEFIKKSLYYDEPDDGTLNPINKLLDSEVNRLISQVINVHITASEVFYQLDISFDQTEKVALGTWKNFKHFIGIDRERQLMHFITMGFD